MWVTQLFRILARIKYVGVGVELSKDRYKLSPGTIDKLRDLKALSS